MSPVVELTDDTWDSEVVEAGGAVLVDFWAPWCVPCIHLDPVVADVAQRYEGRVTVGKLNIDEHPRSAGRYDVLSLPALILFVDGQQVSRLVGVVKARDIDEAISLYVS
jgi:thioredoxin 1